MVGDAFDFAFKANLKNLRIYKQSLYAGREATARHWGFFIALFVGVADVIVGDLFRYYTPIRRVTVVRNNGNFTLMWNRTPAPHQSVSKPNDYTPRLPRKGSYPAPTTHWPGWVPGELN